MEISREQELRNIAKEQREWADKYFECRSKAGRAKKDLDILLAAELTDIQARKKNVGIEMAHIMLIAENIVAQRLYEEWTENEAKYKGIERILEAHQSTIMMEMSLLKWRGDGEKFGRE